MSATVKPVSVQKVIAVLKKAGFNHLTEKDKVEPKHSSGFSAFCTGTAVEIRTYSGYEGNGWRLKTPTPLYVEALSAADISAQSHCGVIVCTGITTTEKEASTNA